MTPIIDSVLSEIIHDASVKKAINLAQHRLDGKTLNLKQQETRHKDAAPKFLAGEITEAEFLASVELEEDLLVFSLTGETPQ